MFAPAPAPAPKPAKPRPRRNEPLGKAFAASVGAEDMLILDVETTGISPASEVVELAVIDCAGNILLDTLCLYKGRMAPGAKEVHGITRERIQKEGRPWPDVYNELRPLLEGARRVWAWNADFDKRLIAQTCARYELPAPAPVKWRCGMIAYSGLRDASYRTLDGACESEGVSVDAAAHSALGDCARVLGVMRAVAGAGSITVQAP